MNETTPKGSLFPPIVIMGTMFVLGLAVYVISMS